MKTAEEILNENDKGYGSGLDYYDVIAAMKEFARQAVTETIEIAKCHSDNPSDTDWEGTESNAFSILDINYKK